MNALAEISAHLEQAAKHCAAARGNHRETSQAHARIAEHAIASMTASAVGNHATLKQSMTALLDALLDARADHSAESANVGALECLLKSARGAVDLAIAEVTGDIDEG